MERHPLYPEVSQFCTKYPDQAGAIWQAFIDLSLSQRWEELEIQDVPAARSCILVGIRPKQAKRVKAVVYPMQLARMTDMASLHGLFEVIEPSPASIFLAISAEDSSIVYYKIAKGIVPPKEVKE